MIQFQTLRDAIDPPFLTLAQELEVAYYQNWKLGRSHPWNGHDVQATPEESKALFDKLHGSLWTAHTVAMADENETRGRPYELDKVDPITVDPSERRSVSARARLKALQAEGVDMPAILAARGVTVTVG